MTSANPAPAAVGAPTPRVDGVAKTTGAAEYTADVKISGILAGRTLRSPLPRARIVRIDVAKAAALPGVHAVVTGADLAPGARHGRAIIDVPVLAQGEVLFVGQQVAAVAADDEEIASRAVELIDIEYEERPPVLDAEEAMGPDAPLVRPDMMEFKGFPKEIAEPSNVFGRWEYGRGDVEAGFAEAEVIVENTFTTGRQHQAYMEPHSCVVRAGPGGRIEVWAPNKSPHPGKKMLAAAVGLEAEQVLFHPVTIGGDFGGKGSAMDTPIAWALAERSGRPVRMVFDYAEELTAANPRHASVIHIRTGVKRDGTLVANEATVIFDSGASGGFKPAGGHLPGASNAAGTPYRIPYTHVVEYQVYTNNVPCGFMRGPGQPQAMFAFESQMDCIAAELGMDPADLRAKNIVRQGDENALGVVFEDVKGAETLEAALDASGYRSPKPAPHGSVVYGRGIAFGERVQGGGETHASVTLGPDGSVVLHTSIFEQGSGSYTVIQQIVAQELGLAPERVSVRVWDTDTAPYDSGIGGARVTRMASQAVYAAVHAARGEVLKLAADLLGWPEDRLEMAGEHVTRTDDGSSVAWAEIVGRTGAPVVGLGDVADNARIAITSFTAQVAEVSVDTESGEVTLLRFTTAHDTGTVLNPIGHQGQVAGGVVQGIGYGLIEDLVSEGGRITTASLADYRIPTAADVPELTTVLLKAEAGVGPYGVKGIGEQSNSQPAPAIANAVADATGVRVRSLPVTAEKVREGLRAS
ncbi:MAG: xanthine dehydrogenase family protein molybdopterin-binding subunit [Chloroflexi bacterium]|nr:xanthine dehydrogenase family protein molybdopterin-binding subunit [Chloroflexota bacterium]